MEVLGTLQGEEGNFEEMVIKLEVLVRAIRPQHAAKGVSLRRSSVLPSMPYLNRLLNPNPGGANNQYS